MTRKDYIEIADVIISLINSGSLDKNTTGISVVNSFACKLANKNTKFNREVFENYIIERT